MDALQGLTNSITDLIGKGSVLVYVAMIVRTS